MIQILRTNVEKFTHIIQVADIHIMLTKRHEEYEEVFKRFYEEVKNSPITTVVFVMGDLVNSKTDLSPECILLAGDFLFNVAELRTTILIGGNHDANLTNKTRLDSLSPIVKIAKHPNLYYLKDSGLFGLGNICINNYSVFDSPEKYIKGCDIPSIYRNQYEYFVVLFHGAVNNSMTDIGFRIVNKSVEVSMFDNHDITLLGDIHLAQTLQEYDYDFNKPTVRYSSSLIQRNHGESLQGHGYTMWDLKKRNYHHVEIKNDYGFFTVVMDNGKIISDTTNIPKKARIQFQLHDTVSSEVKSQIAKLRLLSDVLELSYNKIQNDITDTKANLNISVGNINDRDYQVKLITQYLKDRLEITDQTLIDDVLKINDNMNAVVKKDDFARNTRWIPIRFEWENMFSYGDGNVIDFTKLKDLVGLFASNASGKSTLLSALSICIFDKCEREFKAGNILNIQKSTFKCKFEFEIDGVCHTIEREGISDRTGAVKVNVRFWKTVDGVDIDLKGKDRNDTNSIIREKLGTYDDFILTSLSVQGGKNNGSVIDMGNSERKDLFAQFMGLSIFDRLHTEADKRFNEISILLKSFNNDDYVKQLTMYQDSLSQTQSLYSEESKSLDELKSQRDELQRNILEETKNLIRIEGSIPPLDVSVRNKKQKEEYIDILKTSITNTETDLLNVKSQIPALDLEILNMEKDNLNVLHKEYNTSLTLKKELQNKIERKKIEVTHKKEKVDREKNHKYDPKCEFCRLHSHDIIEDAEKAKQALELDKKEVTELLSTLNSVDQRILELEWTVKSYEKYDIIKSKTNKLKTEQISLSDKLNRHKDELKIKEENLKTIDNDILMYHTHESALLSNTEFNKKIEVLKLQLKNLETIISNKNKVFLDTNGKISIYTTQIEHLTKKITDAKSMEKEYKVYDTYIKAVNRDGIPFDVITITVPEVEREVNSILSQITNFTAKFETDGKNIIPYIVYDDKKWLMSLTSGFERFALSLAIRVSLINISNLPRPNFLVIDEGFGVLDAENLSSMHLLFSYLKSNFDFIMVISHLEALRDMVDMHVEITKDNGFSKINLT